MARFDSWPISKRAASSFLPLIVVMAAVHVTAPADRKAFSLVALAFMTLCGGLTCCVHFIWLTVLRQTSVHEVPPLLRCDPWPTMLLALDLLAWGPLLGLSLLAAAPVFRGGKLQVAIRLALILGGTLSLAGTLGPASGDLRFCWPEHRTTQANRFAGRYRLGRDDGDLCS